MNSHKLNVTYDSPYCWGSRNTQTLYVVIIGRRMVTSHETRRLLGYTLFKFDEREKRLRDAGVSGCPALGVGNMVTTVKGCNT